MRFLADLAYLLAGLFYLPVVVYQAVFQGKNRRGWGHRLGFVPWFGPDGPRIWVHAVSLGEMNATPRLIQALGELLPGVEFVFSTTTDTGFARGVALYGPDRVFRFPLDFSVIVRRVLGRVNPSMIVLVELEVWPNLVRAAAGLGIPVAVVNGRLTERSHRRLRRLGRPVKTMFHDLTWVCAQDAVIAERFRTLGVDAGRIEITSSLKWDTANLADHVDGSPALAAAMGLGDDIPLWVCGSTGPGEEAVILEAHRLLLDRAAAEEHPRNRAATARERGHELSNRTATARERSSSGEPPAGLESTSTERAGRPPCRLAIVPRKPERFDEVARLIERAGFVCARRSAHPDGGPGADLSDHAVILGDTMGELRKWYSLASVVFVGRSLVPMGGSDPMEVAALAKPMIIGPHAHNFEAAVAAFRAAQAIRTAHTSAELCAVARELLGNLPSAARMGQRARAVVVDNQGATRRTAERLAAILRGLHSAATDRQVSRGGPEGAEKAERKRALV